MSRDIGPVFKAFGYVARARRTEIRAGSEEHYWTVRCRRKADEGEWSLGWFPTRRQAEAAFDSWVEKRRRKILTPLPQLTMIEVIDRYIEAVNGMNKRPQTILNRRYTATQLRSFVVAWGVTQPVTAFDEGAFEKYLVWLRDEKGYSPQTVENALIGARTFLRWASPTYLPSPPKAPAFHVPANEVATIYVGGRAGHHQQGGATAGLAAATHLGDRVPLRRGRDDQGVRHRPDRTPGLGGATRRVPSQDPQLAALGSCQPVLGG